MADGPKAVDPLCVEHGLDARQLAAKCGLDEAALWQLCSPGGPRAHRAGPHDMFKLTRDQIVWGH